VFLQKIVSAYKSKEYSKRLIASGYTYFILSIKAMLSIRLIATMPAKKMIMESLFFALVLLTLKSI
jgi:hypothetical protein